MGAVLLVSGVPPALVHPIILHGKWIQMVHIHLYQVPFSLCRPCRYVLDERDLTLWTFNSNFDLPQCSLVTPSDTPWVNMWIWYHSMLPITKFLLIFASFVAWPINTGDTTRLYIWPQTRHWFIFPPTILRCCLVGSSYYHPKPFFRLLFTNGPDGVENMVPISYTFFCITMVGGIFYILSSD